MPPQLTPPELPEPADPADAAMAYEDALDALHSPREILARALQRATEADDLHDQLSDGGYVPLAEQLTARQRSALGVATVLASIAQAAVEITEAESLRLPELEEEVWEPLPDKQPDKGPVALACRFTASFDASMVGDIGGREMMLVRHYGWLYTFGMPRRAHKENPERFHITLSGRAVSQYNDQILAVTDEGVGMTLPADLVRLEADE